MKDLINQRQWAFDHKMKPLWRYLRNSFKRQLVSYSKETPWLQSSYYNERVRNLKMITQQLGTRQLEF